MSDTERIRGKIKKIEKRHGGWGFISSFEKPFARIFFHWTGFRPNQICGDFKELRLGMDVEFECFEDMERGGYKAIKIEVINVNDIDDEGTIREANVEKIK